MRCCITFSAQSSSDAAVDQNEKAYAEIILMADKRRCAVNDLVRDQEKIAVSRAEALVDRLKKEISELRKREDELKWLSLTDDNVYFLQVQRHINIPVQCVRLQLMLCL